MQTCPNCQATLMENTRFCMSCGAPMTAKTTSIAPANAESVQPMLAASSQLPAARQRQRLSSRTIAIASLLLCLLFFSPFVSCGNQTLTGAQAFQASIPQGRYDQPKEGLFLIILPIAGIAGIVIGLMAMQRVESSAPLGVLRALGIAALLAALVSAFPIGVAIMDVNRSNGMLRLEWGFWGSAIAALAMLAGAVGLVGSKDGGT
jgi:hypothetical protein